MFPVEALAAILLTVPAPNVPSPAAALFARWSLPVLHAAEGRRVGRAQTDADEPFDDLDEDSAPTHPNAEEERNLEEDMKRARRHRKGTKKGEAETLEAAPAASPAADSHTHSHATAPAGGGEEEDDEEDLKPTRASSNAAQELEFEGHGWRHYMVWGIVDWGIAGTMWAGSVVCWVIAAFATQLGYLLPAGNGSGVNLFSVVYGLAAVGLGGGGALVAWRAGVNIGRMRELRNGHMPE